MPDLNAVVIANVLRREGERFVQEDRTCSRFGVTLEALADWRGSRQTADDVKALTREEATAFYRWLLTRSRIDQIGPLLLRDTVFDIAVHSGTGRAVHWLQRALGVEDDGLLGPQTLAAVTAADADLLRASLVRRRLAYLGGLIASQPARFAGQAEGWLVRVGEFVR